MGWVLAPGGVINSGEVECLSAVHPEAAQLL